MLSYEADPGRTRHAAAATVIQIQAWVRSLICRKELSKLSSNAANQKRIVGKGGLQSIIALADDKDRIIHVHAAAEL